MSQGQILTCLRMEAQVFGIMGKKSYWILSFLSPLPWVHKHKYELFPAICPLEQSLKATWWRPIDIFIAISKLVKMPIPRMREDESTSGSCDTLHMSRTVIPHKPPIPKGQHSPFLHPLFLGADHQDSPPSCPCATLWMPLPSHRPPVWILHPKAWIQG